MLNQLTTKQKVAVAIALPASMVLLYLLFKKKDEELQKPSANLVSGQRLVIEMAIPHSKVGPLIGREGCNIKKIQADSGANVKFQDETKREDDSDRQLKIYGNPDNARLAERMILEFLAEQPEIFTIELMIPQQAVGRIIGRQGTNIRRISTSSKAKVFIDRSNQDSTQPELLRRCTIKGTMQQIDCAKHMIEEGVATEAEYRQRLADAAANRKQRPTGKSARTTDHPTVNMKVTPVSEPEKLWHSENASIAEPPSTKDFFTVYMSGVEHPEHFWLQIVNSKASQLDLMGETMTEFYNKPENQQSYAPGSLKTGDIVAAPFSHDQSWYRARILGFLEDDMLDIYYADYGDCASVPRKDVCILRGDFLSLPFQAVEFSLADVQPVGDEWTEEGIVAFEELTHVAKWIPLMAKIVDYQSSESGTTIPSVELFDTNGNKDVNIREELISRGFARSTKGSKVGNGINVSGGGASNRGDL